MSKSFVLEYSIKHAQCVSYPKEEYMIMKSNASIALALATAMFTGTASAQDEAAKPADQPKQEPAAEVSPEKVKQDVSYFLGFQSGNGMAQIPSLSMSDIDTETFLKGLKDGMEGNNPGNEQDIQASLQAFQKTIDARIAEIAKKNLEASKKFMEENAKKEGVVKTESGLQYKVTEKGGDKKYNEKDYKNPLFKIKYKGTTIDGDVFDETKGEAVDMPLQVIPGFAEALKTMPIGAKWTVFIPAELAYGEQSPSPKIQPNSPLIFDIELEGISEAPEQPMGGGMQITPEQLQEMLKQSQAGEEGGKTAE